jgi:heat shock protein HtpX
MNQRQWVPMEESSISKKRVIGRMAGVIVAVDTVVLAVVGALLGYPIQAALIGLIASALFVRTIGRTSESAVLAPMVSRDASPTDHARLESDYPLAMAVARPEEAGTIVVSTGFCEVMERVEVEAVMAHLLWRIRTGEVALTTYVLSLVRWFSRVGLGAIARAMASRAMDERVLLWADLAACQATRYPPALVSALEKTEGFGSGVTVNAPTSLWFASPDSSGDDATAAGGFSSLGVRHPSLAERIAVLKEI